MIKALKKIGKWSLVASVPIVSTFFITSGIIAPTVVFNTNIISKSVDWNRKKVLERYKNAFSDDKATLTATNNSYPYTLKTNSASDPSIKIEDTGLKFNVNNKTTQVFKYSGHSSKPNKVLVFSHGLNGTRWTAMEIARPWIEKGYTIYSYDQRDAGSNQDNGKISFGWHEGDDLSNLISTLTSNNLITNSTSVILYGRSNGTGTILSLLEKHKSQVDAIPKLGVFLESVYTSPRSALNGIFNVNKVPHILFMPQSKPLAEEYMKIDLDEINYLDLAPSIKQKVYIIHGKGDRVIPYSEARKLDEKLKSSKITLYDGLGHLGMSRSSKYAAKLPMEVTTWLGGDF